MGIHRFLTSKKNPFEEFAKQADLVYFGEVHERHDLLPVRGITFTSHHLDEDYIQGPYDGRDLIMLRRITKLRPRHVPDQKSYEWTIAQLPIQAPANFHLFIDGFRYDEDLYQNIFTKFASLRHAEHITAAVAPHLSQYFRVFCPIQLADLIEKLVAAPFTQYLASHYQLYDIEITEAHLRMYRTDHPKTAAELKDMAAAAVWLTEQFETAILKAQQEIQT